MMAARVLEVADAVVAFIQTAAPSSSGVTVERRIPPDAVDAEKLIGRWVYVFPTRRRFGENRTRGRRAHVYEMSIVVVERVPKDERTKDGAQAWSDGVLEWVEDTIFLPLTDEEELELIADAAIHPVESGGIVDLQNPVAWTENKLFWSQVDLAFWEG